MVPQDPGVGENALQETPQTQGEGRHASCEVRVPEATAARLLLQRWPDIEDEDAADSRDHTSHENGEVPMGPEAEPGALERRSIYGMVPFPMRGLLYMSSGIRVVECRLLFGVVVKELRTTARHWCCSIKPI